MFLCIEKTCLSFFNALGRNELKVLLFRVALVICQYENVFTEELQRKCRTLALKTIRSLV